MSRARNIKPGFFENEDLAECNPLARLLFAGLWCEADREGRLEDRPKRIKAKCLPYDDVDCDQLLNELAAAGFITRYVVEGSAYIAVNEFSKHQNPHQREVGSAIPAPSEARHNLGDAEHNLGCALEQPRDGGAENCTGSARLIPDSLIPDSLISDSMSARSTGAGARAGETIDTATGEIINPASPLAQLTPAQGAVVVMACKALRKMGTQRFHVGDDVLATMSIEGFTAEQIVRCAAEKALRDASLLDDPDVHPELFELFINGGTQAEMFLTAEQHTELRGAVSRINVGYVATTLRNRRRDAEAGAGSRMTTRSTRRPSATDDLAGKTYVGTPIDRIDPLLLGDYDGQ